jgi:hypothetical protein
MSLNGGTFGAARQGSLRGGFFRPFWFDESPPNTIIRPLAVQAQVPTTYKDRLFLQDTSSSITDFEWEINTQLDRTQSETITFTSSNEARLLPPVGNSNIWTGVSAGAVTMTATSPSRTVTRNVTVVMAPSTNRQNFSFANGSFAAVASAGIDTRIASANPVTSSSIFSTQDTAGATYVRNPSCWIGDVDLTCIPGNNNGLNGVLISADVMACATHAAPSGTIHFITTDNQLITRTVVGWTPVYRDVSVVKLSSPLPGTITPCKILPNAYNAQVPLPIGSEHLDYPWAVPIFSTNRLRKAIVSQFDTITNDRVILSGQHAPAPRNSFWQQAVSGDSGSPSFFVVNNSLVALMCWYSTNTGDSLSNTSALTTAINTLGSVQPLNIIDLSAFPSY